MKILVTGGTGFLGSYVVEKLCQTGYEVVVLSRNRPENSCGFQEMLMTSNCSVETIQGDIANLDVCKNAARGADAIVHLAAVANPQVAKENNKLAHATNIVGFSNILEAATDSGIKRFVFASTSQVYGNTGKENIVEREVVFETSTEAELSVYAQTKLSNELLVHYQAQNYNFPIIALRFFTLYGERLDPNDSRSIIPIFIDDLHNKRQPIIFGDVNRKRDFIHAADAAHATFLAVTKPGLSTGAYNIGTGIGTSVGELFNIIKYNMALVSGFEQIRDIWPCVREASLGSVPVAHPIACTDKAREELGFYPAININEGVARTVNAVTRKIVLSQSGISVHGISEQACPLNTDPKLLP